MQTLTFTLETQSASEVRTICISRLIIAGWTGRDRAKMEEHILELEKIGVKRPQSTPIFYRGSASRLAQSSLIEVPGNASSGEAEPLLINDGGRVLVGIASDHTDRAVEAYNITVSKQMCDKPCSKKLWLMDELRDHWDGLQLTATIEENGKPVSYQQGTLSAILPPEELIAGLERAGEAFTPGTAMLCGTLLAIGGVRTSRVFEMTLNDPILARSIGHRYETIALPVRG